MTKQHRHISKALDDARRLLPNLPEPLIDPWLANAIAIHRWPPRGDGWSIVLRRRHILYWRTVRWTCGAVSLKTARFTSETRRFTSGIMRAAFANARNPYEALALTHRDRLKEIAATDATTGPFVFLRMSDGRLESVDGALRLAVLLWQGKTRTITEAWVGDGGGIDRRD